jgi:16S rRNA (uracil1498-N3)-methyltransferase
VDTVGNYAFELSDCNGFPNLTVDMNLILLENTDFTEVGQVRLTGRRLDHIYNVHRVQVGDELRVGLIGGKVGTGRIEKMDSLNLDMSVKLEKEPPEALPIRLVLALPRPKVLNRTIAAAVSMGIREIDIINSWRVEKAYWNSPRLSDQNLRMQSLLGLEQAGDTLLPTIRLHKLFTPFVKEELPAALKGQLALVADPGGTPTCPHQVGVPVVLAIGPEGGFIERELETLQEIGFTRITLGPRILRVETALAYLMGRLF